MPASNEVKIAALFTAVSDLALAVLELHAGVTHLAGQLSQSGMVTDLELNRRRIPNSLEQALTEIKKVLDVLQSTDWT